MSGLTSNIMKVGALLSDTIVLTEVWDFNVADKENVKRIVDENLLGLPSRSRANDVMVRALSPRFVGSGDNVLESLRELTDQPSAFRDACYYELTRVDDLVAAFAEEQLTSWWDEGRLRIATVDARVWIDSLVAGGRVLDWSDNIRNRVARGMMAALRDFGRLHGIRSSTNKEIARPGISVGGFAYVSYRLHQQGFSDRAIRSSNVWLRWLLDERSVDDLLHRLASRGVVYYSVAGSSMRIDWRAESLPEVVRAAA